MRVLSFGAITQSWTYDGIPLVLGYEDAELYRADMNYAGAIVGRVAGRVRSPVDIHGTLCHLRPNEGSVHLHGGPGGLSRQMWDMTQISAARVDLHTRSLHGAEGYPGTLDVTVTIRLSADGVTYDMTARPDRPTWVSMAQHNYYCLGADDNAGLDLDLSARAHLELDDLGIATGVRLPLSGKTDLRGGQSLAGLDLDHAFQLDNGVIILTGPAGQLRLQTDQPCVQVYTGMGLVAPLSAGQGVALEPQGFPNALNCPSFPQQLSTPDQPYVQSLRVQFLAKPPV